MSEESHVTTIDGSDLPRKIGFAMAATSTLFGLLYLVGLVGNLLTTGSVYPTTDAVQMISATVALLWNQVLLVLFTTLRWQVPGRRKILADLMLVFAVMVCVTSSISWFVRLTIVPQVSQTGSATLLALLDPYNPASLSFAREHLGWGLFFGLAALFAAFALQGDVLMGWVRWLLAGSGILSLFHELGVVVSSPLLIDLGYPAWGVLLPAATLLLAIGYRRKPDDRRV
jgi:uncharacterized membrane protein